MVLFPRELRAPLYLGALALCLGCAPAKPNDEAGASTQSESDDESSESGSGETSSTETGSATETGAAEEPEPPGPEDYPQCDCAAEELCVASCMDAPGFPPPDYIPCDLYCLPVIPDCPRYEDPQEYCEDPECLPVDCNGSCDPNPVIPSEFIPVLGYEAFCSII